MITMELLLFISVTSLICSMISLWAFGYALHTHKQRILSLYDRLNYLGVGMHYHGLVPLPWEMDDLDEIKTFKREGNVVYLQQEE